MKTYLKRYLAVFTAGLAVLPAYSAEPKLPTVEEIVIRLSSQYGMMGTDYAENTEYYTAIANYILNGNPARISCWGKRSHGGVLSTIEYQILRLEYIDNDTKKFVVSYNNIGDKPCQITDIDK